MKVKIRNLSRYLWSWGCFLLLTAMLPKNHTLTPTKRAGLGADASPNPYVIPKVLNAYYTTEFKEEAINPPRQPPRSTNEQSGSSPSQRRPGPRHSESHLTAQMQALDLSSEKITPIKKPRRPRNSEPAKVASSFGTLHVSYHNRRLIRYK